MSVETKLSCEELPAHFREKIKNEMKTEPNKQMPYKYGNRVSLQPKAYDSCNKQCFNHHSNDHSEGV